MSRRPGDGGSNDSITWRSKGGIQGSIVAYADGSCIGNPGPGGWGVVLIGADGSRIDFSGAQPSTTNNRMEITAAIEALRRVPAGVEVTIRTDSQYLVKTMTLGWKRRENLDLWKILDAEAAKRKVRWEWVRGHSGNILNEEADRLAHDAALGKIQNLPQEISSEGIFDASENKSADPSRDVSGGGENSLNGENSSATPGDGKSPPQQRTSKTRAGSTAATTGLEEREIARRLRPLLREGEGLRRCSNCGRGFVVQGDPPVKQAYCSLVACQLKLRSGQQHQG